MSAEHVEGEPAPRVRTHRWLPEREEIGAPDCLLMYRWTVAKLRGRKLLVHHFLPDADDVDYHDHPRGFLTLMWWGSYTDLRPDGTTELLRAPAIRWRPAEHAHRTKVGPRGAWTFVIMGKLAREWGFWRSGRWYFWRDYERMFGFAMRCDSDPAEDTQ